MRQTYKFKLEFLLLLIAIQCVVAFGLYSTQTYSLVSESLPIKIFVNERPLDLDVPPVIVEGRTLLPIRQIFETLDVNFTWDGKASRITAYKEKTSITLRINNTLALVNDSEVTMDIPPMIVGGRTMVPVRFIAEALNAKITWDPANMIVAIFVKDAVSDISDEVIQNTIRTKLGKESGKVLVTDLKKIKNLNLSNKKVKNLAGIDILQNLEELDISDNLIEDISPITKLKRLTKISLKNNMITDFSPLNQLYGKLITKDFSIVNFPDKNLEINVRTAISKQNGEIFDFELAKVTTLNLDEKKIINLEGLQYCVNLEMLSARKNDIIDLSPLQNLKKLLYLYVNDNKISDITPLSNLKSMTTFVAYSNKIKNINALEGKQSLETLGLSSNSIIDISPIATLKNLRQLYLDENPSIKSFLPLSSLINLESLSLSKTNLTNLNPISNASKLAELWICGNPITDLKPIKNLPSLKKMYFLNFQTPTILNQELCDKYDSINAKIVEIIKKIIVPNMSDYDKVLSIHDYLVTHTKYDEVNYRNDTIPDQSHSLYGVFENGVAVCDGYSYAMKVLCTAAGIESSVVYGKSANQTGDVGHAWNAVKIGNDYFYLDATFDDPTSGYDPTKDSEQKQSLSHRYLTLSKTQLLTTHEWNSDDYPACNIDGNVNITKTSMVKNYLDKVYLLLDNKLYIKNVNDIDKKLFCEDEIADFCINDTYLYYISKTQGYKLFRASLDGSYQKMIWGIGKVLSMEIIDKYVFFLNDTDEAGSYTQIVRIQDENSSYGDPITPKKDWVTYFVIYKNNIYYKSYNFSDHKSGISKVRYNYPTRLDSNARITPDNITGFNNDEFYVYADDIGYFFISDDWIYYTNADDNNCIYKINIDGSGRTKLNSRNSNITEIVGDYIYYLSPFNGKQYYRIKTDGTGNVGLE